MEAAKQSANKSKQPSEVRHGTIRSYLVAASQASSSLVFVGVSFLVGSAVLLYTPQVSEIINEIAGWHQDDFDLKIQKRKTALFLVFGMIWALGIWYSARAVLGFRPHSHAEPQYLASYSATTRVVLPRFLGIAAVYVVCIAFSVRSGSGPFASILLLTFAVLNSIRPEALIKRRWLKFIVGGTTVIFVSLVALSVASFELANRFDGEDFSVLDVSGDTIQKVFIGVLVALVAAYLTQSQGHKNLERLVTLLGVLVLTAYQWSSGQGAANLFSITGMGVIVFTIRRRELTAIAPSLSRAVGIPEGSAAEQVDEMSWWNWAVGALFLGAFALLSIYFGVFDPLYIPGIVGVLPLGLFSLTVICVVGTIGLVMIPRRFGWPNMAWLSIVLPAIFSIWVDRHEVRTTQKASTPEQNFGPAPYARPSLDAYVSEWVSARKDPNLPIFVVTSAGGGLRAAHITGLTLSWLDDITCGMFGQNTLAISSVSGGSLGVAAYLASRSGMSAKDYSVGNFGCMNFGGDRYINSTELKKLFQFRSEGASAQVKAMLNTDFLSPVLAGFFYTDLLQAYLPIGLLPDRAAAFEKALEQKWFNITGNNIFAEPFIELLRKRPLSETPIIAFNSTDSLTGRRVVTSNARFATVDAFDFIDQSYEAAYVSLSTAVHNSARFPLISPGGFLETRTGKLRVTDGGYFDNSGSVTIEDVLDAVARKKPGSVHKLVLITINNDSRKPYFCVWPEVTLRSRLNLRRGLENENPGRCGPDNGLVSSRKDERDGFLQSVSTPLRTMLAAREARGRASEWTVINWFSVKSQKHIIEYGLYRRPDDLRFRILKRAVDYPLGWMLSRPTALDLEDDVTDQVLEFPHQGALYRKFPLNSLN